MIIEREKACFLQGLLMATSVVNEIEVERVAKLATEFRRALCKDDGAHLLTMIEIAGELYDALQNGGFDGAAATRPVQ